MLKLWIFLGKNVENSIVIRFNYLNWKLNLGSECFP